MVVMNGWFTHEATNWPPSDKIIPLFFGFHLTPDAAPFFARHRDYFAKHAPIGCRDEATAGVVRSWGVDAYVSGCATMTFPTRSVEPEDPKLVLVDQTAKHFLKSEKKGSVRITHKFPAYVEKNSLKLDMARTLLDFYRDNAGMVVTSRIHCAMPCAAMGIPVAYTGVRDGRTGVVDIIGIPSLKTRRFPRTRLSQLPANKPSFDSVKQRIIADLHKRLLAHGIVVKNAERDAGLAPDRL